MGSAVPPTNTNARGLGEARAIALGAAARAEVASELLAHGERLGLVVAALEVRQDALELVLAPDRAPARVEVAELDLLPVAALHQDVARLLREARVRRLRIEAVVVGERLDHLVVVGIPPVPAAHRAVRKRELGVGDHAVRVEELFHAEPVTARAGAERVVEGEEPWLELGHRIAADPAGELVREHELFARRAVEEGDTRRALAEAERRLEGFREPLLQVRAHLEPVHDRIDRMLLLGVELRHGVELHVLAIDARTHEALAAQFLDRLLVLALAPGNDRRSECNGSALRQGKHLVHHLAHGLGREVEAVVRAARDACAREEEAQVIVDLGHRADGRARVVGRRFLLDRNRGREPFDRIHVRLLHHRQELPRVGRQRLDVAALALGIDGVEGERGLAGSGEAGEDDQAVARQLQVEILEVVRARAADVDGLAHRGSLIE